jgi:hypothetical protein
MMCRCLVSHEHHFMGPISVSSFRFGDVPKTDARSQGRLAALERGRAVLRLDDAPERGARAGLAVLARDRSESLRPPRIRRY